MEGLEISVVKLSQVVKASYSTRWDSFYFQKEFLKDELKFKSWKLLESIAKIKSGTTPKDRDENLKEGVILLKTNDIRNNIMIDKGNDFFYISESTNKEMLSSQVESNDILINIVGATTEVVGRVALIPENFKKSNITQAMSFIRLTDLNYTPAFLFIFFQTKYGLKQTRRIARPTGQYNINNIELGSYRIPPVSESFQSIIESLVKSAHSKLEQSKSLYAQAENLLLEELGLKDWQPKNNIHTTKKYSDFVNSGRLDAEYYQSKYDEIERELARFEQIKIKDLINYPVSSGSTPKSGDSQYYADSESGTPFLRAVDIVESRVDTNDLLYIKKNVHNGLLKRTQLKKGDVLFSIAGTVGRCGIFDYDFEANINQAVAILRFDEAKLKHLYVIQYFNSRIGQLIIQKYARQGLQTNLNLDELSNLPIPLLPEAIQTQIATLIQQSFECKAESKKLLEEAKRMVEEEIEN